MGEVGERVECRDVTLIRGQNVVIDRLTHRFEHGRITALVGPNGSGKSTLLKALYGYLVPSSGAVTLEGTAIPDWSPQALAQKLGVCPQEAEPSLDFQVGRLLSLRHGGNLQKAWGVLVDLDFLDLRPLFTRNLSSLSGGERQRVRLGLALSGRSPWLILDEPANHLDLSTAWSLFGYLESRRETGVILALHDLPMAARFCHRLIVLQGKEMVVTGAPREVLTGEILQRVFGLRGEFIEGSEEPCLQIQGVSRAE